MCKQCGKNFNVANIDLPASPTAPAIKMPPLMPPPACVANLESRSDDNFTTVKRRLEVRHWLPDHDGMTVNASTLFDASASCRRGSSTVGK